MVLRDVFAACATNGSEFYFGRSALPVEAGEVADSTQESEVANLIATEFEKSHQGVTLILSRQLTILWLHYASGSLDESSRITFPFDPGARLKRDQCKSSLLENERGIFNDIIDRKLFVFEKYSELAGKSVLDDVFLKMHCYNLQTKAGLLHKLNMEQTGPSLVFALRHNQYLTVFAEFTWLIEWMQYSLFGDSLLRDDSSAMALVMDRFSTQLQESPVKMIERLNKVLEFVSAIHDLCDVLGIDFLRIVTKVYPRMHDLTDVNSEKLDAKGDCKKKQIADLITISHIMRFQV